jgi:hypothetical protein
MQRQMQTLDDTKPNGFRLRNGDDYAIPSLTLREVLESAGQTGLSLNIENENE